MGKNRIKIDMEDVDGTKYGFTVEGAITKAKVLKVFEAMELMNMESEGQAQAPSPDSVGSRIWHVVEKEYPAGRFTSTAVLEKYEDEYNLPIKLSIISTYLARFAQRGRLERVRTGREWSYQLAKTTPLVTTA